MDNSALKVLVVEDEPIVLLGFKTFLTQLGYEIVGEAYDGEMAVCLANELEPDFLIMDVKMPLLDGIEALVKINSGRTQLIPCIFVTAHSDNLLIDKAKKAGAFSYLIKPVTIENLKASIEITLQRFNDYLTVEQELKQTKKSLTDRKIINRAKGFLIDNFDMKEKQAMEYLQKKSRNTNRKLITVAEEILKMDERLKQ